MEIAAGGELYDFLSDRKCLEELEARRVFRQIATAIAVIFFGDQLQGVNKKRP